MDMRRACQGLWKYWHDNYMSVMKQKARHKWLQNGKIYFNNI